MACTSVRTEHGFAILCTRARRPKRKCSVCAAPAERLCDWLLASGRTCDKPLCRQHAVRADPDLDYCPDHGMERAQADLFDGAGGPVRRSSGRSVGG